MVRRGEAVLSVVLVAIGLSAVGSMVPVGAQTTCPAQTLAIPASAATPNLSNPDAVAVDGAGSI